MTPRAIYSTRVIERRSYILSEKIADWTEAQLAAQEYRLEGFYARVEPVTDEGLYYIWTAPGRVITPRVVSPLPTRHLKVI